MSEALALVALAAGLGAAVVRPRWAPEWAVTIIAALLLLALGTIGLRPAWEAIKQLGPTVGFLAALLLLADGCRRDGLFRALGALIARGSHGRPVRLLGLVFVVAATTTAVLSLDATIVLLTPVVFATTARLRANPRPTMYTCSHLANSASLLLPVSNLTNLLAFHASGLSFTRFAELMLLPWLIALTIEWVVLRRRFADDLRGALSTGASPEAGGEPLPRFSLTVVVLALAGFALSSVIGIAPVWTAVVAAAAMVLRSRPAPRALVSAAEPSFLAFVLALGVIVQAASQHGLAGAVDGLLPSGAGFAALLAVAAISAVLANLVNNLPATLIVLPAVTGHGAGPLLAMLIGVNVGPNLTYVGSLATLLWRRIVHSHEQDTDAREFTVLGLLTVPLSLLACTAGLWLALQAV